MKMQERQDDHRVPQEVKLRVQFGETAVAKDTDRYRLKLRIYSGRLVRLVSTFGKGTNCLLFGIVEIRTLWQLIFGLDSGDSLLLDLEDKDKENAGL
jgi:hypothetical protein